MPAFAQATGCRSLRAIEVSLNALPGRLYHLGIRGHVSRSMLADANVSRGWRIFADFGRELIRLTRPAYAQTPLALKLKAGRLYPRLHHHRPVPVAFPLG